MTIVGVSKRSMPTKLKDYCDFDDDEREIGKILDTLMMAMVMINDDGDGDD